MGAMDTLPVGRARVHGHGGGGRRAAVRPVRRRPARQSISRVRRSAPVRIAGSHQCAAMVGVARRPVAPCPATPVADYLWRRIIASVAVVAAVAVVVFGLGLLSDLARAARVPSVTAKVTVEAGESLWQVARRVAPSADPGAVAARIVELNGLASPSVRPGEVLDSPIG